MARVWLPALRGVFAPTSEAKSLPDRVRASTTGHVVPGIPYSSTWDVRRAVEEAYEANPLVFRAIEVICTNAVDRAIVLFDGHPTKPKRKIEESAQDPSRLLYVLNRRANPLETALIFRHRLVAQFLLSSRGCFIEVVRTRSGKIGLLNLIDPDLVRMVPTEDNPIAAFEVRTPNASVNAYNYLPAFDPSATAEEQPSSILWVRAPHPLVMWKGMSPVQAAGMSIDLDKYARVYNRRFLQNDGRPGGLLSVKGAVHRDQLELIQAQFAGGPESAGRTTVISADAVSYADTSGSPRDLMWGDLSRLTKADISIAFGVPESVLGDASGRCVTPDTEALTQRGWVTGEQLTLDDTILTLDPADGRLKWSPVLEVYRKDDYSGPLYTLGNIGAAVTAGHKWVVEPRTRRQRDAAGDDLLTKVTVEQLGTHDRIVTMGEAEGGASEAGYSTAFVELVGWAVTEGHFTPNETSLASRPTRTAPYVRIRQNAGANAERIIACAKESGARLTVYERDGSVLVNLRGEIAAALHQVAPDRILSPAFMLALTVDQRRLLMATMLDADGCTDIPGTASQTFAQKDRRAAEAFVFLATLCGHSTSIRERTFTYRHRGVERPVHDWLVIVRQRKHASIQSAKGRTVEHYDGAVWCPRTAYGTFVARRGGKVFVTSNTFDNANAEYTMFWQHRMRPLLRLLDDQLDILTGGYDDDLYLRHDLSDVWVLGHEDRERADRSAADLERGAITYDEYRVDTKRDPIGVPATSVLWLPVGGKMAASADEDAARAAVDGPMAGAAGAAAPEDVPSPDVDTAPDVDGPEGGGPRRLAVAARQLPAPTFRRSGELEGKQRPPRALGPP